MSVLSQLKIIKPPHLDYTTPSSQTLHGLPSYLRGNLDPAVATVSARPLPAQPCHPALLPPRSPHLLPRPQTGPRPLTGLSSHTVSLPCAALAGPCDSEIQDGHFPEVFSSDNCHFVLRVCSVWQPEAPCTEPLEDSVRSHCPRVPAAQLHPSSRPLSQKLVWMDSTLRHLQQAAIPSPPPGNRIPTLPPQLWTVGCQWMDAAAPAHSLASDQGFWFV